MHQAQAGAVSDTVVRVSSSSRLFACYEDEPGRCVPVWFGLPVSSVHLLYINAKFQIIAIVILISGVNGVHAEAPRQNSLVS